MSLSARDLDELRAIVREEIERADAKRRGRRVAPRSRSLRVAAVLSAKIAPSNDIAKAIARKALGR